MLAERFLISNVVADVAVVGTYNPRDYEMSDHYGALWQKEINNRIGPI